MTDLYQRLDKVFSSSKDDKSKVAQETLKSENEFSLFEKDQLESFPEEKFK
ncbi:hypothetical protein OC709_02230 ['Planchonia careya' phytoplasma]|nr:hypothetical protein ['Planchonia careya' phytoplasma]MDO8030316.1 hypothetical protein ['Planchonia careya' phytoplasma]